MAQLNREPSTSTVQISKTESKSRLEKIDDYLFRQKNTTISFHASDFTFGLVHSIVNRPRLRPSKSQLIATKHL